MTQEKIKRLLKVAIELLMPDLDHYRKPLRKGRVVETYSSDGRYVCDIEILLNNNQPDETEPIVRGVEIPVIWGGVKRGFICPPAPGTHCDVEYYHGDPDYPRVSNFRWLDNEAPDVGVDELIIQQTPGVHIHIKANGEIEIKSPNTLRVLFKTDVIADIGGNVEATVGGNVTAQIKGNVTETITGNVLSTVTGNVTANITGALTADVKMTALVKAAAGVSIDGGSSDVSGVVTNTCICPITLAPHVDFSKNVFASKGG